MTKEQLRRLVKYAVGDDDANATAIAEDFIDAAIVNVGRIKGADFNWSWESLTFTADQSTYVLGVDVLAGGGNPRGLQELWRTDVPGWPITIMDLDDYNTVARGGTDTGPPQYATIHASEGDMILEVYPTPDAAYTCKAGVRLPTGRLEDIPDEYHDIIYAIALSLIAAAKNPSLAASLAFQGIETIQADSMVGWSGSTIKASRSFGEKYYKVRVDSGRLR